MAGVIQSRTPDPLLIARWLLKQSDMSHMHELALSIVAEYEVE